VDPSKWIIREAISSGGAVLRALRDVWQLVFEEGGPKAFEARVAERGDLRGAPARSLTRSPRWRPAPAVSCRLISHSCY